MLGFYLNIKIVNDSTQKIVFESNVNYKDLRKDLDNLFNTEKSIKEDSIISQQIDSYKIVFDMDPYAKEISQDKSYKLLDYYEKNNYNEEQIINDSKNNYIDFNKNYKKAEADTLQKINEQESINGRRMQWIEGSGGGESTKNFYKDEQALKITKKIVSEISRSIVLMSIASVGLWFATGVIPGGAIAPWAISTTICTAILAVTKYTMKYQISKYENKKNASDRSKFSAILNLSLAAYSLTKLLKYTAILCQSSITAVQIAQGFLNSAITLALSLISSYIDNLCKINNL